MGKKLVILGADFSANAIDFDKQEYGLVLGVSIVGGNPVNNCAGSVPGRANMMVTSGSAYNPINWSSNAPAAVNGYSLIEIPPFAKKVTVKMTNTLYKFGLVARAATSVLVDPALYDSGWKNGGATASITLDLTLYPTTKYIYSTIALISGSAFTTETKESIGWSIEWEF